MTKPYKNRYEGFNSAKHIWACEHCRYWHYSKPVKCALCKHNQFYYFASKVEAEHFAELQLLESGGIIFELQAQVYLPLIVNDVKVSSYIADFMFVDKKGETKIQDVKANINDKYLSPEFKIKRKLVKALYGVDVDIIKRRSR